MNIRQILSAAAASLTVGAMAALPLSAQKKPLDHSVYDSWQTVSSIQNPYGGNWLLYSITLQDGDDTLHIYDIAKGAVAYTIPRGSGAVISQDGSTAVYLIEAPKQAVRQAKIDKKKAHEMPKDTLVILDLKSGTRTVFPDVDRMYVGDDLQNYVAYRQAQTEASKEGGRDLYITDIRTLTTDTIAHVDDCVVSSKGEKIIYATEPAKDDSLGQRELHLLIPASGEDHTLFSTPKEGLISGIKFNEEATAAVFYSRRDTSEATKDLRDIFYADLTAEKPSAECIVPSDIKGLPEGMGISDKATLRLSKDGRYLVLGVKELPEPEDETVPDFEKVSLDIWRWDADYLPTQVKINKSRFERQTLTALYYFDKPGQILMLADETMPMVSIPENLTGNTILVLNDKPYRVERQWDPTPRYDLYRLNIENGERELISRNRTVRSTLSPDGRYAAMFDAADTCWHLYDIVNNEWRNLTADVPALFWDDEEDTPSAAGPTGPALWYKDGSALLIGARFDVWKFYTDGSKAPENMTEGIGAADSIKFTPALSLLFDQRLERRNGRSADREILDDKPLYFSSFNDITKETGIYLKDLSARRPKMQKLVSGPATYRLSAIGSGKKPVLFYTMGDFRNPYDLYRTSNLFKTSEQLTDINPQQDQYRWGSVELVDWMSEDGAFRCEGMLFTPDDLDSTGKYPMVLYFYERNSDGLYSYRAPAPSRSIINISYFVSNGYIVFVPDIYYHVGHPGQSAMNCIMPGVDKVLEGRPWIDSTKMALQGQSWGGYQTAYMITQTDRFAAAGAGAPVSNMTSAYGGIRWGSGVTRQMQYEHGQSRIGDNLWDGFDLYVENSPLFFVRNVTTPVLIMHNDEDGAVPWYQGIEFFTALRRCGKQAWMLTYNGEDHNLVQRYNCKDYTVKLVEFFDHFLKGEPMPEWMK